MDSFFKLGNVVANSIDVTKARSMEEKREHIAEMEKYFHLNLDDQETLLAGWIVAVFTCVTVSLVFYSMLGDQNRVLDERAIAIITIALIIISLLFNVSALYNFINRTNLILEAAEIDKHKFSTYEIIKSQRFYAVLTILVSAIELYMVYVIVKATLTRLRQHHLTIFGKRYRGGI